MSMEQLVPLRRTDSLSTTFYGNRERPNFLKKIEDMVERQKTATKRVKDNKHTVEICKKRLNRD
jgi:hypothetical protein